MATPPTPARSLWRRVFRPGFPQVVIALALLVLVVIPYWPLPIERQWLNAARYATLFLAGLLLSVWALFFSSWRRSRVIAVLILLVALPLGLLDVHCDGDMGAVVEARSWVQRLLWGQTHSDRVRQHRAGQAGQRPAALLTERPGDMPAYRGLKRDGVALGPPLSRDWSQAPPRLVWRQPIDGGYAGFAVVNGFLVTIEQRDEEEAVVCYDAQTGKEVWSRSWPGRFKEVMGGIGPRATPTVHDGAVFALGAEGRLVCLDGATGTQKWSADTLAGNANARWGMSGAPLAFDDLVVVTPGVQQPQAAGRGVIAYDRRTGTEVWTAGRAAAGYSSPSLVELAGKRQILVFDGAGLAGYDPAGGAELWRFAWTNNQGINVGQPVVVDADSVFIATGYGKGGALVRITQESGHWQAQPVWTTKATVMRCKFTSPVLHGGHVYGLNDGRLECVDLKTGRAVWTDDRRPGRGEAYGHGQLLVCGDQLLVLSEYGELVLVEATSDALHEVGRLRVLEEGDKTWNNPALAHGRIYVRNYREMACLDLTDAGR